MSERASVVALVAIVVLTACSDSSVTQPRLASGATISADIAFFDAHPPPPPIDTDAVVSTDQGSFTLQTTYFLNKTENNGFISFASQQPDGITVEPDARISLHNGDVSGAGMISLVTSGGVITIDLANAVNAQRAIFNPDCTKTCATVGFTGTFMSNEGETGPIDGTITVGGRISTAGT